jgi:hypothetical protein
VACYLLHRPFEYVTIAPEEDYLGSVVVSHLKAYVARKLALIGLTPGDRNKVERDIVIDCAGYIAEQKAAKNASVQWSLNDLNSAIDVAGFVCSSDDDEAAAYVGQLFVRAKRLLEDERNCHAVEALANALLEEKTIRYRKAREIIAEAIDEIA